MVAEQRRATLHAELQELDRMVQGYTRRQQLLDELVSEQAGPPETTAPSRDIASSVAWPSRRAVRGRELRRIAAQLLWRSEREGEIHYREWFERVMTAGFAISGKDPAASFLTNIRDSPAVIRGSKPGYYRLEPHSLNKLEGQIGETQAELTDLQQSLERARAEDADAQHIDQMDAHQAHLTQILKRMNAEIKELKYIFSEDQATVDPALLTPSQLAA